LREWEAEACCDNIIQERLFLLEKLKRKYGGSLEKVIETGENLVYFLH